MMILVGKPIGFLLIDNRKEWREICFILSLFTLLLYKSFVAIALIYLFSLYLKHRVFVRVNLNLFEQFNNLYAVRAMVGYNSV